MAFLNYEYRMVISYSEPVDRCYFTIKCIPPSDFRQRSISYDISMLPLTTYSEGMDSFGNIQIIGREKDPHSMFEFVIKGLVETYPVEMTGGINENLIGMYKYPHGKCVPGENILAFAKEISGAVNNCANDNEKCRLIMKLLYEKMTYESGSTEVETPAEEAFTNGKGVCQDYSHIFICLLRYFKIPARYVCGLLAGEGKSHSWVEAVCGESYVSFDPTHNRLITDQYIKLGVGRDAADCAINRGVMWGGGAQTQEINVNWRKIW